jgi:hypothetical protein
MPKLLNRPTSMRRRESRSWIDVHAVTALLVCLRDAQALPRSREASADCINSPPDSEEPGNQPVKPIESGRRDSNPRPSHWQGGGIRSFTVRCAAPQSTEFLAILPGINPVVERSTDDSRTERSGSLRLLRSRTVLAAAHWLAFGERSFRPAITSNIAVDRSQDQKGRLGPILMCDPLFGSAASGS